MPELELHPVISQRTYPPEHLALVTTPGTRFWAKVDVPFAPDGCWTWTAGRNGDGYGSFQLTVAPRRYRATGAHRLAYVALIGDPPAGFDLDHLCRNRACVRPDHLEPVDHRTNVLRGEGLAAQAMRQERCRNGHPFDGVTSEGHRLCTVCRLAKQRRFHTRRKEAAA